MNSRKRLPYARFLLLTALIVVPGSASSRNSSLTASTRPTHVVGNLTGTVNGTAVNLHAYITMDYTNGHTHSEVSNVPPTLGSSLRVAMSIVTVAGGTCAVTSGGAVNGSTLFGGNMVRTGGLKYLGSGDSVTIVHNVSYTGGDSIHFTGTINGTIPVIAPTDSVALGDLNELWHQDSPTQISAGLGNLQTYRVGPVGSGVWNPPPPPPVRHGKIIVYPNSTGLNVLPFDETRHVSFIEAKWLVASNTNTWDMYNVMTPMAVVPMSTPATVGVLAALLGTVGLFTLRRRRGVRGTS